MKLLKTRTSLSLVLLVTPLSLFGAGAKTPPTDLERITVKPPVEDFEYPLWWSIDGGMQGGFDGGMGGGGGSFPTETAKEQPTDDKEKDCNGP